ncbi:MAG: LPXTG cell wall anchor domain-containing protein, partial [Bacillus sp. (in: firmicutes)]
EIANTLEHPSLAVEKTADKAQYLPGETVTYTINVTNDGNVDLEGITLEDVLSKNDVVADQQLTLDGYEGAFDLAIGETASFTSSFVIPENDLADTTYKNVVTATTGDTTGEDEETIVVNPTYAFTVEKTADKEEATVGDTVTYTIVVTNTGNKALTNVHVADDMIGLDTVIDQLEVNESKTLTGKYVVTAGDIGELENIATASVEVDGKTITHDASAIVKVSAKAAAVDDETPTTIDKIVNWVQNPKTGDTTINTLLILFVFVLAGCGLYVYRRKHRG